MTDGRSWVPGRIAPPPERQPVEHMWSIRKEGRQFDCQLRGHGEWGWEVQLLRDGDWFYGRRYATCAKADAIREEYVREGGQLIG